MIYHASAAALAREGGGVKHACFTDERVARDPVIFEPHILSGSYCLVFFVRGFRCGMDELLHRRGVWDATFRPAIDGLERIAGE